MLKKSIQLFFLVILLLVFLYLFLNSAHASVKPAKGKNGWETTETRRLTLDDIADATSSKDFTDIIEATARKQATNNGSSEILESVIRETVDRKKVGGVLLKRLLAGGIAIGATQALLDGVGWIMEDGVYVKYKLVDPINPPDTPEAWCDLSKTPYTCSNNVSALKSRTLIQNPLYKESQWVQLSPVHWSLTIRPKNSPNGSGMSYSYLYIKNPYYKPGTPPKTDQRIVLTPELVGDLAVGDYTDPVDSSSDKKDGVWTGVEDAYKHDPTGTGNEVADSVDQKHERNPRRDAKPVPATWTNPDGTPKLDPDGNPVPADIPKPDGEGYKYPAPGTNPGTEGTVKPETNPDGSPKTDEEGKPTGESKFQLPAFCSWATVVCEWLEWTQEDDLPEKEEIEIDELPIEEKQVEVKWHAMCPEASTVNLTIEGFSQDFAILDPQYICAQAPILKPVIIFSATLTGLYILFGYGASRGKDE